MKPTKTIYRLSQPSDVKVCKQIWAENKALLGEPKNLSWPTVVAERDGKILGFLSTNPTKKFILAGPMALGKYCHIITAIRLVEAYEAVLRMANVTNYWFFTEKKNEAWLRLTEKIGITATEETDEGFWFKRILI